MGNRHLAAVVWDAGHTAPGYGLDNRVGLRCGAWRRGERDAMTGGTRAQHDLINRWSRIEGQVRGFGLGAFTRRDLEGG